MYLVYKGEFPDGFCEKSFDNLKDAKEFLLSLNDENFCIIEMQKYFINNLNENLKNEIENLFKELEKCLSEINFRSPRYDDLWEPVAMLHNWYEKDKKSKIVSVNFEKYKNELQNILDDYKKGIIKRNRLCPCEAIRGVE